MTIPSDPAWCLIGRAGGGDVAIVDLDEHGQETDRLVLAADELPDRIAHREQGRPR